MMLSEKRMLAQKKLRLRIAANGCSHIYESAQSAPRSWWSGKQYSELFNDRLHPVHEMFMAYRHSPKKMNVFSMLYDMNYRGFVHSDMIQNGYDLVLMYAEYYPQIKELYDQGVSSDETYDRSQVTVKTFK